MQANKDWLVAKAQEEGDERDALSAQLRQLKTSHNAVVTERDALAAQQQTLQKERDAAVARRDVRHSTSSMASM